MEADDLLCSRNAHAQKVLVRRAQWKINQPPSLERYRASLERSIGWCSFDARSKGQLRPLPLREVGRSWKALAWANGTSWRADGWRVRKLRAVRDQSGQPIFFSVAPSIVTHPLK